jgi:3-oxoadipate enol-lactonase/4-carboxymuconolactone decarboxylase
MPFVSRDGVRLYWKLEGADERPVLVLLNSIGTDMSLWDAAVPHLLAAFRLLRLDTRGHGASDAPDGDYSLAMLADDVVAVMEAADVDRAAVAGVSLGGMIAMELALCRPARVAALALVCTSATMDRAAWADRVAKVRAGGTAAIADLAMGRFLSPGFVRAHPEIAESVGRGLIATVDAGRLPHTISLVEGVGFEPSVPRVRWSSVQLAARDAIDAAIGKPERRSFTSTSSGERFPHAWRAFHMDKAELEIGFGGL